ncbi:hypothetical protein BT96DRAFT_998141 [Gymnopus androsaceus JB14]|uniref:Uncharacterized protein n=1 Tax=Gymnopus androsaceus JB14 TaxID=1447944 RepID=A0A6A4HB00_9AGAR|nr:hypothetical protein BT96DRAFT_998141 [Gymnopus androsaceus JB14]
MECTARLNNPEERSLRSADPGTLCNSLFAFTTTSFTMQFTASFSILASLVAFVAAETHTITFTNKYAFNG